MNLRQLLASTLILTSLASNMVLASTSETTSPDQTFNTPDLFQPATPEEEGAYTPSMGVTTEEATFPDIGGHWGESFINQAVSQGYFAGNADGTFAPDATITRAQFIVVMTQIRGITVDVMDGPWYTAYFHMAEVLDIIPASFNLDNMDGHITREEMAYVLVKTIGEEHFTLSDDAGDFTDIDSISALYLDYVTMADSAGIMKGREDGSFDPSATAIRAEGATVSMRAFEFLLTVEDDTTEEDTDVEDGTADEGTDQDTDVEAGGSDQDTDEEDSADEDTDAEEDSADEDTDAEEDSADEDTDAEEDSADEDTDAEEDSADEDTDVEEDSADEDTDVELTALAALIDSLRSDDEKTYYPLITSTEDDMWGIYEGYLKVSVENASDFAVSMSPMSANAYCIAVVEVVEGFEDEVVAGFESYKEAKIQEVIFYESAKNVAESAVIRITDSGYVILVMCEDAESFADELEVALKG